MATTKSENDTLLLAELVRKYAQENELLPGTLSIFKHADQIAQFIVREGVEIKEA